MNSITLQVIGILPQRNMKYLEPVDSKMIYVIETGFVEIGSQPIDVPNVTLKYAGVSRRQSRLSYIDKHWVVEDMGSDNGTWLIKNNKFTRSEVGNPLVVENGIQVLFGSVVMKIDFN